jgi:hypothetical protein
MPSYHDEMIHRAPHVGLAFQSNNIMVWNMLRHVLHRGPGWSWIQAHAALMDGRGAYNSLKRHYLGESFAAHLRASADQVSDDSFFKMGKEISRLKGFVRI